VWSQPEESAVTETAAKDACSLCPGPRNSLQLLHLLSGFHRAVVELKDFLFIVLPRPPFRKNDGIICAPCASASIMTAAMTKKIVASPLRVKTKLHMLPPKLNLPPARI
jgi:hypothetical protein